ncbi:MAG: FG-GAP-like repeat-containing protein, partial [Saprospiraceae bacterium]|nr:FG-GAP-like repeat-containing protein [Saprospiraceae bacterium]
MSSSATAALPTGFKATGDASPNYTGGTNTTATTQAAGTTGTGVIASNSSGGTYNFADGITASATDRALGFLTSGSFSSPRSIMLEVENTTGFTITQLDIAFDYEKYRSGTRAFAWTFFSSTDGSTWTAQTNGDQAYAADANNTTVSNPPAATPKTVSITGLSIPNNGKYYLRWTFAGTGGSTNGQGIGIDNFSVTATVAQPEIAVFENYPNEFDCADGSADIMVSDPTYFTGGSYPFSFTIANTGSANLNITSITETSDPDNQFELASVDGSPLAQNESTQVEFTFSPTSAGNKTAKFTINSNDSDESACVVNVTILGTAATCDDGFQNGGETGVDCGGPCPACPTPCLGTTVFTPAPAISTSADAATSVYAVDVDGDGDVDVLSASANDDKIVWYENDGSETFTAHTITTSADEARSVYAVDVDGDGDVDVLSASFQDDKIAWYENDGNESFTAHTITASADGAFSVYAVDVDGDGDVDVLSASFGDNKIAWYENDGSENFTAHTITTSADQARSVYTLDVDGDGDVDVLSASQN